MALQALPMRKTISKSNGKEYNNLDLKPSTKYGTSGIDDGNHIIVTKGRYAPRAIAGSYTNKDGSPKMSYSCQVMYNGESCSFFLNQQEYEVYQNVGGEGDQVKISLTEEKVVNPRTNVKEIRPKLTFDLV